MSSLRNRSYIFFKRNSRWVSILAVVFFLWGLDFADRSHRGGGSSSSEAGSEFHGPRHIENFFRELHERGGGGGEEDHVEDKMFAKKEKMEGGVADEIFNERCLF